MPRIKAGGGMRPQCVGLMAADPLKEVLLKVVQERHQQIAELTAQYHGSQDPVVRAELEQRIQQLQKEQIAAQGALQMPAGAPVLSPDPVPAADTQLLGGEAPAPKVAKAPSLAALQAQASELQVELLDAARAVEQGGASPNPMDVEHLRQTREKLQAAMRALGEASQTTPVVELPPKPTPSQQAEADNLVRQSRVFKMRGQGQMATDTLRKAAELAPGAVSVLEALGDDLLERGQAKPAADTFQKALAIDPRNVSLERKYALAVAKSQGTLSIEEAMNLKFGDSPLAAADAASARAAAVLSFFIPGAGQIVLGEYAKGGVLLAVWLGFAVWLSLMPGRHSGMVFFVPIAGMLVVSVVAATMCVKGSNEMTGSLRKKGVKNRPAPPMDLPFE